MAGYSAASGAHASQWVATRSPVDQSERSQHERARADRADTSGFRRALRNPAAHRLIGDDGAQRGLFGARDQQGVDAPRGSRAIARVCNVTPLSLVTAPPDGDNTSTV